MCGFRRAFLLSLLAGHAAAMRESSQRAELAEGAAANQSWLMKSLTWCSLEEGKLACDDESIIKVKSAFYNRQKKPTCKPALQDPTATCPPNALALVQGACDKKRHCTIPAQAHEASCPESPFTFLRVRYECISGEPENADDAFVGDGALMGGNDGALEAVTTTAKPPEPKIPVPSVEHVRQEVRPVVIAQPRPGSEGASGSSSSSTSTTTMRVRGEQVVKAEVQRELDTPQQELSVKPCYRFTRLQRILAMQPFSWLTDCHHNEGCFKVEFYDGRVFEDPEAAPEPEALLPGHLVAGADSVLVTFLGMGLQRNDYSTWGICLPKTQGIEYAMTMFHSLQVRHVLQKDVTRRFSKPRIFEPLGPLGTYRRKPPIFGPLEPYLGGHLADWPS